MCAFPSEISACSSPKQPSPPTLKHANTFVDTLLRTLCRSEKTQLLCNQANPNSFDKTSGVWGTSATSPRPAPPLFPEPGGSVIVAHRFSNALFSYSYKSLFPQLLYLHIYPKPLGVFPPAPNFQPAPRCFDSISVGVYTRLLFFPKSASGALIMPNFFRLTAIAATALLSFTSPTAPAQERTQEKETKTLEKEK